MKRLIVALLSAFVFSFAAQAQAQPADAPKMSVRSFALAENDNTANLHGTTVIDQNGDPCALIRVQTTQTGFAWDFGQMQPCKVEQKTGEVWLYVPYGVKRVTVRHAQLGTMTYEFPIPVAKARTYIMDLVAANVTVIVEQEITQQYVVFRLNPADAVVELDGKVLETRNGTAKKFVRFGKYPYTVTAKDYHPVSGEVEVRDAQSSTVVNVELKPAFGSLAFAADADLKGAVVFVDGEQAGTIPFSSALQVASGQHQLKIVKPKYKVFNGGFEIADGQSLKLSPELEPNFATVTVSTLEGAEIVANGTVLGKAPWTGPLEYDTYSFEIRKPSHRTVYRTMEFYEGAPTQISLPQPLPIYGALDVDSDNIAKVSLDGSPVGETPCFIPKVLIGEHVVTFSAPGFSTVTKTVTVPEGKTEMVGATLVKGSPEPSNRAPSAPSYAAKTSAAKTPPAAKSSSAKLKKNLLSAGCGLLTLTGTGDGFSDLFHMYSVSAGFSHDFIKKHVGVSTGIGVCQSFRTGFNGADYSALAFRVPLDVVLRFGKLRFNAGLSGYYLMAKAESKEYDFSWDMTDNMFNFQHFVDFMPIGFQAGVRYELTSSIVVGYGFTGNISNLSCNTIGPTGEYSYRLDFASNMFYVVFQF